VAIPTFSEVIRFGERWSGARCYLLSSLAATSGVISFQDVPSLLTEERAPRALTDPTPEAWAISHGLVGTLLERTGNLAGALAEQRCYKEKMRAWWPSPPPSPTTAATSPSAMT
jgi:hypothetical protein